MNSENPILNSPYDEPLLHYATDADGALNYQIIKPGRGIFIPDFQNIPVRQPPTPLFVVNHVAIGM